MSCWFKILHDLSSATCTIAFQDECILLASGNQSSSAAPIIGNISLPADGDAAKHKQNVKNSTCVAVSAVPSLDVYDRLETDNSKSLSETFNSVIAALHQTLLCFYLCKANDIKKCHTYITVRKTFHF